jgi:hypothetical protein
MVELTPEQQRSLDATVGSIQRIATRIVQLPREPREQAFTITRRNFEESIQRFGLDGEQANRWLDLTMGALRALVSEIEWRRRCRRDSLVRIPDEFTLS